MSCVDKCIDWSHDQHVKIRLDYNKTNNYLSRNRILLIDKINSLNMDLLLVTVNYFRKHPEISMISK